MGILFQGCPYSVGDAYQRAYGFLYQLTLLNQPCTRCKQKTFVNSLDSQHYWAQIRRVMLTTIIRVRCLPIWIFHKDDGTPGYACGSPAGDDDAIEIVPKELAETSTCRTRCDEGKIMHEVGHIAVPGFGRHSERYGYDRSREPLAILQDCACAELSGKKALMRRLCVFVSVVALQGCAQPSHISGQPVIHSRVDPASAACRPQGPFRYGMTVIARTLARIDCTRRLARCMPEPPASGKIVMELYTTDGGRICEAECFTGRSITARSGFIASSVDKWIGVRPGWGRYHFQWGPLYPPPH